MAARRLTEKQRQFAEHYILTDNAFQSACAAGYTETYARAKSHLLPSLPLVEEYIAKRRDEITKDLLRPDKLIAAMASIAYSELTDVVSIEDGKVTVANTKDLPKNLRMAITSIRRHKKGIEVKMGSKERALLTLFKVAGLMERQGEQQGTEDLTALTELLVK